MNTELLNTKDGALHNRGIARKPYKQINENSFENKRSIPKPHFDEDAPTETPQMFSIYSDPDSAFYKQKNRYNFDLTESKDDKYSVGENFQQQIIEQKNNNSNQRQEKRQKSPDSLPHNHNQIKINNQYDNFSTSEQNSIKTKQKNNFYKVQVSRSQPASASNHTERKNDHFVEQKNNNTIIEQSTPIESSQYESYNYQTRHDPQNCESNLTEHEKNTKQSILKKENKPIKGQLKQLPNEEQGSLKAAGIVKAKAPVAQPQQKRKNVSILARLRNALIGMSLAYLERLESIGSPMLFIAKNSSTLLLGFMHLFMPIACAWFISNWNESLQEQFWGNSIAFNAFSFISLAVVSAFPWSLLFLTSKGLLSYISGAINQFANQGASYLEKNKNN